MQSGTITDHAAQHSAPWCVDQLRCRGRAQLTARSGRSKVQFDARTMGMESGRQARRPSDDPAAKCSRRAGACSLGLGSRNLNARGAAQQLAKLSNRYITADGGAGGRGGRTRTSRGGSTSRQRSTTTSENLGAASALLEHQPPRQPTKQANTSPGPGWRRPSCNFRRLGALQRRIRQQVAQREHQAQRVRHEPKHQANGRGALDELALTHVHQPHDRLGRQDVVDAHHCTGGAGQDGTGCG